jgi:hypothetical protein
MGLLEKTISLVKDETGKLVDPDDYVNNVDAALARYSKHRPAVVVEDITGDDTQSYDLPTSWVVGFSSLQSIEFPLGEIPPEMLDNDDYELYQSPDGWQIRLINDTPDATEDFRITYTIPQVEATVPTTDLDAVALLAAALCLEELASALVHTGDSLIQADVVNYRDKTYQAAARAKRYRELYKEHLGLKEDDSVPAASAVVDFDLGYPGGGDRLTHPRRQRDRR